MQDLSLNTIELILKSMANTAIVNEKYFSELDSAAGDADFGVSLANGFRAVLNQWAELDRSSIGSFLMKVGLIITSNVGGCSGPIWGTGFIRAGMVSKGKISITLQDTVLMLRSSMEGIMARGGAQLGDKTLLDALASIIKAFEEGSQKNPDDVIKAFQDATIAATKTIESTRDWVAKRGRQSFTGDRSKGTLDPGIVAVATMMESITKELKKIEG
jgi:dihydroxyacetone kinase-like protein